MDNSQSIRIMLTFSQPNINHVSATDSPLNEVITLDEG